MSAPGSLRTPSLVFQQALASGRGLPGLCQRAVLGALTSPRRRLVSCAGGGHPGNGTPEHKIFVLIHVIIVQNLITVYVSCVACEFGETSLSFMYSSCIVLEDLNFIVVITEI